MLFKTFFASIEAGRRMLFLPLFLLIFLLFHLLLLTAAPAGKNSLYPLCEV